MALSVAITVEVGGDRGLFERTSKRLRKPRDLMLRIGVLAMSSAVNRLTTVLRQDADAVRSGRLAASLTVDSGGGGGAHTVFRLRDREVEVGSNLRYAAQVQKGGRIEPTAGKKALAIPLPARLKRSGLWPSDVDPDGELLSFVPTRGGASGNVFGLLVDDEGLFGEEGQALYALARYVDQEPRPFLYFSDEDQRVIDEELVPQWLGGE